MGLPLCCVHPPKPQVHYCVDNVGKATTYTVDNVILDNAGNVVLPVFHCDGKYYLMHELVTVVRPPPKTTGQVFYREAPMVDCGSLCNGFMDNLLLCLKTR